MEIREAQAEDFDDIWEIIEPIVRAGETYAFDPTMSKAEGFDTWMTLPLKTYVVLDEDQILGTYYLKANAQGPSAHVCNCGYMTGAKARGKGLATKMCEHSQQEAIRLGFKAMQYNSVVSTNSGAVRLWEELGYSVVGTLPKAFNHPQQGYVDAYVMYKWLA